MRCKTVLAILLFLLNSCASNPTPTSVLTVYAAASLTEAFTEIAAAFEAQNPGVHVVFNFAGSQQLAQQIIEGAPVDVFASANASQMESVTISGQAGDPLIFANNRLVIILPADNPAEIMTLADLTRPDLRLVLAAEDVPVGAYTLEFLDKASQPSALGENYKTDVLRNVMSFETNVKAVFAKVSLGEADAGVVYSSDASVLNRASQVMQISIPDELNVIARYPVASLRGNPQPRWADAFITFVLSTEGQEILATYGFLPGDNGQ